MRLALIIADTIVAVAEPWRPENGRTKVPTKQNRALFVLGSEGALVDGPVQESFPVVLHHTLVICSAEKKTLKRLFENTWHFEADA